MTQSKMTMLDKRLEAKRLYIIKDLSARAVGKIVNVSETTLSKWVRIYKWKEEKERIVNLRLDKAYDKESVRFKLITDFGMYWKEQYPHLSTEIDKVIKGYLKKTKEL